MLFVCLFSGIFWCIVHYILSERYNRNKILWSFLGIFFGLFTFIILLSLGKNTSTKTYKKEHHDTDEKYISVFLLLMGILIFGGIYLFLN